MLQTAFEKASQWRPQGDHRLRDPFTLWGSQLAPPTALFHHNERYIRSIIEPDAQLPRDFAVSLCQRIYEELVQSKFVSTGSECEKIEALAHLPRAIANGSMIIALQNNNTLGGLHLLRLEIDPWLNLPGTIILGQF